MLKTFSDRYSSYLKSYLSEKKTVTVDGTIESSESQTVHFKL